MDRSILEVFEDECKDLQITQKLAKRINLYLLNFMMKNEEHIAFFGGNLLGVQTVRFTDEDRFRWFDEVIEADEDPLEYRLHALPKVNPDWNVSSDVFNLSCIWLLHAVFKSHFSEKEKHQTMVDILMILQCKYLTSLLFHYFQYPADKAVAEATYAELTYKFDLKEAGSWKALLEMKSENILSKDGIHRRTIETLKDDGLVVYMLNDTQGRIRASIKSLYAVFKMVQTQGVRITTTSSVGVEHDGIEVLKDKSHGLMTYTRYINAIISDRNSFIRDELCKVIEKMIHTMPPKLFRATLEWMSDNYRQHNLDVIEEVVNEAMVHSFDYFAAERSLLRNSTDIPSLLSRLKGTYTASRGTDPALTSLREKAESVVSMATHNKNKTVIASVRTGVLLYIVSRTICMRHYSNT
jgi:hypothetical protein